MVIVLPFPAPIAHPGGAVGFASSDAAGAAEHPLIVRPDSEVVSVSKPKRVSTGATNEIFLGSIVAAGVAGVLSFAAWSVTPEEKRPPDPPHLNRFERLPAPMRLFWVVIGFMVVIGVILVIQALASHPG